MICLTLLPLRADDRSMRRGVAFGLSRGGYPVQLFEVWRWPPIS
jgi:hypothetical protein